MSVASGRHAGQHPAYLDIVTARILWHQHKYAVKSVKLLHKVEFMIVITVITDQGTKGRHKSVLQM